MPKSAIRLAAGVLLGLSLAGMSAPAAADDIVVLSNQLRPIEEAQKFREVILKDFGGKVEFIPEDPGPFMARLLAEHKADKYMISLVAALKSDLPSLVARGVFDPIDDVAAGLADRKLAPAFTELGKYGTKNAYTVPWMQASYIMVVNKKALPYLPQGADVNALTYDQLAQWGANIKAKTGDRKIGLPAGPKGLVHRVFQGYLYPSFTGGLVTPFRSDEAKAMWASVRKLWTESVNPQSTTYNFMQEPLLAEEVWIAIDHSARLLDALNQKPDEFLALPAPAGPKGRGHMPVIVGLGITKGAPNRAGAAALIKHLTDPKVQITTLRQVGFFPVSDIALPDDLPPGVRLTSAAIAAQGKAKDGITSLLPVGLGEQNGQFNKVFTDAFQRIILRNEDIATVLDEQAEALRHVLKAADAPCWHPDKPSNGVCPVN